jgi:hypothetical protein
MVWVVEKKMVKHILEMGYERVGISVRIKFEFEVKERGFAPDTLSKEVLYNQKILEKRYPMLTADSLDRAIGETADYQIEEYLKHSG